MKETEIRVHKQMLGTGTLRNLHSRMKVSRTAFPLSLVQILTPLVWIWIDRTF